jgi:hypothetical protein
MGPNCHVHLIVLDGVAVLGRHADNSLLLFQRSVCRQVSPCLGDLDCHQGGLGASWHMTRRNSGTLPEAVFSCACRGYLRWRIP